MNEDDNMFDGYVETTVSIGQLPPIFVFGVTTCLLFLPVIWLSLRPSNRDEHESGDTTTSSKINISLEAKLEELESSPLLFGASADSSEYGGLSPRSHSDKPRGVVNGNLNWFNSRDSSPRKSRRTLDSLDKIGDDEIGFCNALKFSDPNTSAFERLKIVTLNNCDAQTKSMLDIGFPYLFQSLISSVSEFIQIGVVGYQLGTEALTAYVIIDLFIILTTDAVGYVITSGNTMIAQIAEAEDKKRDKKIGIYMMLSAVFYVIGMIPLVFFWSFYMEDFLLLLKLDPDMAEEGQRFAIAYVLMTLISGIACNFQYTLDVLGFQVQTTIMVFVGEVFATFCIVLVMCYHTMFPNPTLIKMGWAYVIIDLCYLVAMLACIYFYGWMDQYYAGFFSSPFSIFRNWSTGGSNNESESGVNRAAVKLMLSNAFQYALSNFIFEGEWQFLILFASSLGSAELAAWGVLGILWEELEGFVSAISDGCEVRVALTLGKGDANSAKLIAYKALWISLVWGIFVSVIFVFFQDEIPALITKDPLLQEMVSYNLPSIALANLVSGVAIMADHILYCQNRAGLATAIASGTSILITLPLAGLSSWYFRFNLIGQTTAVAIGAAAFAAIALFAVVSSDWNQIAEAIRSLHAESDDDDDDEDSDMEDDSDMKEEIDIFVVEDEEKEIEPQSM